MPRNLGRLDDHRIIVQPARELVRDHEAADMPYSGPRESLRWLLRPRWDIGSRWRASGRASSFACLRMVLTRPRPKPLVLAFSATQRAGPSPVVHLVHLDADARRNWPFPRTCRARPPSCNQLPRLRLPARSTTQRMTTRARGCQITSGGDAIRYRVKLLIVSYLIV